MSDQQHDRQEILDLVRRYWEKHHQPGRGERIPYAGRVYDAEEMVNLADSMLDFWLTAGRFTEQFEKRLASFLSVKHALLVNSGSSANLLAFMSLTSPMLGERAVRRGDEVITVACAFPTTVAPIIQYGAVPVFVDVTIPQYNVDPAALERAYTDRTKAVMLAHTLGNPFHVAEVRAFCDRHQLWLIEDNCDALGSKYTLNGKEQYTGTFGDIGTSSFYPPHHITTGEGGAVYTNHPLLHRILLSMRDWGRDCTCPSGVDNRCGHRFDRQYGELPAGYDHKYVYSHFGYNLKATDMQASIGLAQLDKLPSFIESRRKNFSYLYDALRDLQEVLILPEAQEHAVPSWFGFPITLREGSRLEFAGHLEESGIQTRALFSGNLLRHPCFCTMRDRPGLFKVNGELANTDRIMRDTVWIGVYPGLTEEHLADMSDAVHKFYKNK